jgi:hypothetical protein
MSEKWEDLGGFTQMTAGTRREVVAETIGTLGAGLCEQVHHLGRRSGAGIAEKLEGSMLLTPERPGSAALVVHLIVRLAEPCEVTAGKVRQQ